MTLNKLPVGESGIITKVGGEGALRLRFLDMGLIPRTEVTVYKIAPLGDPVELHLRGYSLTIRMEDAANIEVDPIGKKPAVLPEETETNGRRKAGKKK